MPVIEIILVLVAALGWLGWWITGRFGLELAHRHRIAEEQTKTIHRYAERYYLPYISLSKAVEGSLQRAQKTKAEKDLKISFFRLAQWLHMRYKWWKEVGAIFILRDPTAEKLLIQLQSTFSKFFSAEIGVAERHTLMYILEYDSQTREFFNKFKERSDQEPLKTIFEKYKRWLHNKAKISSLAKELQCFYILFEYEINMCYKSWYGEKPPKPKVDFDLVRGRLNELKDSGEINHKHQKKYLQRLGYKGLII